MFNDKARRMEKSIVNIPRPWRCLDPTLCDELTATLLSREPRRSWLKKSSDQSEAPSLLPRYIVEQSPGMRNARAASCDVSRLPGMRTLMAPLRSAASYKPPGGRTSLNSYQDRIRPHPHPDP